MNTYSQTLYKVKKTKSGKKTPTFRPVFGLRRFAAEIASALEPSRVKYPKRRNNPTKSGFLTESNTPGVPSSYWRFNRKCIFQDGCRRHLELQNLLLFLYYSTNPHQIW